MASIVMPSREPHHGPLISFPEEENASARRYLRGNQPEVTEERHDPAVHVEDA